MMRILTSVKQTAELSCCMDGRSRYLLRPFRFASGQVESTSSSWLAPRSGLALLLVMFILTLMSIIVVSVAHSAYLSARVRNTYEQQLRAEYLLKSALSVARVLIMSDSSQVDPPRDAWGPFVDGIEVPSSMLGVSEPNTSIALEIRPEGALLPLGHLTKGDLQDPGTFGYQAFIAWRNAFAQLFENVGFDTDKEVDQTGLFPGRVFRSKELVANLLDYFDSDSTSLSSDQYSGVESQIPPGRFPNSGQNFLNLKELETIPGFTPRRMKAVYQFVSPGIEPVNVNLAPVEVLMALDENLTVQQAREIRNTIKKNGEGFSTETMASQLVTIWPLASQLKTESKITFKSAGKFTVTAKVQFGDTKYFLKASLRKAGTNQPPTVENADLYG